MLHLGFCTVPLTLVLQDSCGQEQPYDAHLLCLNL